MRLSNILSNEPKDEFAQVEGFLEGKPLSKGKQKNISIGNITLLFYCHNCDKPHTFGSHDKPKNASTKDAFCIGIDKNSISIDCVLTCASCHLSIVPTWFLVKSNAAIFSASPNVKILKRSFKLSENASLNNDRLEGFTEKLEEADRAYAEDLGAGSAIYLRQILENITHKMANIAGVDLKHNKNFNHLIKKVNMKKPFIPPEFSENGYPLFSALSGIIHGSSSEESALEKYPALRRLIVAIIENVKNNKEIKEALCVIQEANSE